MKYILLCLAAFLFCFGIGSIPARFLGKKMKGHVWVKKTILTLLFGLLFCFAITFAYLSVYYHADSQAIENAYENPSVQIETINGGYFFDGPGEESAMIFYPGAKVDTMAYTLLMTQLAEKGIDCFLADVPFHMAMFGSNLADQFIQNYSYKNWILAGHSMGGIVASGYAGKHSDQVKGLVMLASYPTNQIPDTIKYCSIYGDKDGCLNLQEYQKKKANWPENGEELCIQGGNHAQFGNYGEQKGDGTADISSKEQQKRTADFIFEIMQFPEE